MAPRTLGNTPRRHHEELRDHTPTGGNHTAVHVGLQRAKTRRHRQVKVDQCQPGQLVAKSTTLSTDLDLGHWTGMVCDHPGHPKLADIASSDLSRYPWKMMQGLAQAIATRARPILQSPTPGPQESHDKAVPKVTTQTEFGLHQPMKGEIPPHQLATHTSQSSPTGTTPATRSNPTTKEPSALSGKGAPQTPNHRPQGSKRSPSRSPAQHRASKGLKALSLLTSGTHTKADNADPPTGMRNLHLCGPLSRWNSS